MLFLGFVSQNKALCEGVLEQMKQTTDWQIAFFDAPASAMDVWQTSMPSLILWDAHGCESDLAAQFYNFIQKAKQKPWLLVIGEIPFAHEDTDGVDFLARPLRLGKLLARLQFYKRRLSQPADRTFSLGVFSFQPRHSVLKDEKNGENIKLTDKETALLEYLVTAKESVSKSTLLEEIWGYGHQIDTHTLETHIYRLRQKLMARNPQGVDCFSVSQGRYHINKAWAKT